MKTRTRRSEQGGQAKRLGIAIFSIAILAGSASAFAQDAPKTWRCGNTYSDRPCEGGRTVKVEDPRSDEDRRAAEAGIRNNSTQADRMERSRLALEKAAYDRDRQAARDAQGAAMAERRLALSEQLARERAAKAARDPRKPSANFSGTTANGTAAPAKKRKKQPSGESDAG